MCLLKIKIGKDHYLFVKVYPHIPIYLKYTKALKNVLCFHKNIFPPSKKFLKKLLNKIQ